MKLTKPTLIEGEVFPKNSEIYIINVDISDDSEYNITENLYEKGKGSYMKSKNIRESSLSRLWSHNENHDCGAMTAFRRAEDCGEGRVFSKKENQQRNSSLSAKLLSKGYGVTSIQGRYPEGGSVGKEESFFIADLHDSGNLETDLIKLGEEFEQDSILFVPKGSIQNKSKAYLIGTNKCPNNWLPYGQREFFENGKLGYESPIYTSYVNGRPFIFENVLKEYTPPNTGFGMWSLHLASKKQWKDL